MGAQRTIYMDHSATTFVKPEVVEAMIPYFTEHFGNPSSIYGIARESKKAIDAARVQTAKALGADPDEIYFTSAGASRTTGRSREWHLRTGSGATISSPPRSSTMRCFTPASFLKRKALKSRISRLTSMGLWIRRMLEKAITEKTILISIMYANNEIGTIEPIAELGAIARKHKVYFHTDAVQAIGSVPIDVKAQNIDLLSLSAHKFYGPKGAGALYIRKGVRIENLIHGGGQERKRRAGTENIAGIVGLGKAIETGDCGYPGTHRKDPSDAGPSHQRRSGKNSQRPAERSPGKTAAGQLQCEF